MHDTLQIGRVLFIHWGNGVVTPEDVRGVLRQVPDARRAARGPLVYVAVAASGGPPPTDEVRKLMADRMEEVLSHCDSMHLVFEGTGFRHTVQRMAMVSIMMMSGKRNRVFIEASLEDAVNNAPVNARMELRQAIASARQRGFFPTLEAAGASR